MTKQHPNSKRKIIQYMLIGGVTLGAVWSALRIALAFFGMVSLPSVMNTNTTGESSTGLISFLIPYIFAVAPYCIGLGAVSAFLYAYIFPDKESQGVLIGSGVVMILYLIAGTYFAWL